jgi:hypothetical protein
MSASPSERVVLGIDAAWTSANPSGVALAAKTGTVWRLIAAAASFEEFVRLADGYAGSGPSALIATACRLAGKAPDLIAVDMPMMDAQIARASLDARWRRDFQPRAIRSRPSTSDRPAEWKSTRIRR